ncbi:MAG: hypothetical protein ACYDAC_12780, partial [Candidatus Dormibacteria bacterium]
MGARRVRVTPQRRPWPRWTAPAMAAAALIGVAVAVVAAERGATPAPPPPPGAAALTAYTTALRAPTAAGGAIVVREMKPSLADLSAGTVDAATFTRRATGWELGLSAVRQRIDAIAVPAGLQSAAQLFDQAMATYVRAASLFASAGTAPPAQRQAIVDSGVATATQADHLYDRAAALVQAALRQAGLPPDTLLPG